MQIEEPSEKLPFQMLHYYTNQMQVLPAGKFSRHQLEMVRGVILVCEFEAKEELEKRLLKKACYWWNQLAEVWNNKDEGEKLELIELKEIQETTALTVRPKQTITEDDKKYLKKLKIRWEEDD